MTAMWLQWVHVPMTNDMMHQANWYLHCQRNVENTATAKLETVATVKMNANVANACTHLNHARQEQIVWVELCSTSTYVEWSNHENDTFHWSKTRSNRCRESEDRLCNAGTYTSITPRGQYFENLSECRDNASSSTVTQRPPDSKNHWSPSGSSPRRSSWNTPLCQNERYPSRERQNKDQSSKDARGETEIHRRLSMHG